MDNDNGGGGGDGALNFGRVEVGLLLFGDVGILSEDLFRWYLEPLGGEGEVFIELVVPVNLEEIFD